MRRATRLLLAMASIVSSACITGFAHPLGSPEDGFIEPRLLGTWTCTSIDDPTPSLSTIMDFEGKQYYVQPSGCGNTETDQYSTLATRIEDATSLSVRDVGA